MVYFFRLDWGSGGELRAVVAKQSPPEFRRSGFDSLLGGLTTRPAPTGTTPAKDKPLSARFFPRPAN